MDSALDSALTPAPAQPAPRGVWGRLAAWVAWLGWLGWGEAAQRRGRHRRMQLDGLRVALCTLVVVAGAVAGALAWTWHQQQHIAQRAAALAGAWVEQQLDTVAFELQRIAAHPDLQTAASACPASLVQALLQESLQSRQVRRFEVLQAGQTWRCGPQGERAGEALQFAAEATQTATSSAGLTLVLGGQIAAKPALMLMVANGLAVKATLDPHALLLPPALWPADIEAATLRVSAQSVNAGSLQLWGARQGHPAAPVAVHSETQSKRHPLAVRVEVNAADFQALLRARAAQAAAAALLLMGAAVAWVWRRAMLRARLVHRLTHALRKRQFEPFVQPIVDLKTGRCIGAEVLMRWNHPQRGILGPGEFIEEAERTGLILGMSDLTMALAAHRLASAAQADPTLYFSFNITPSQLREPGFAQRLTDIFRHDTVPREQVLLEVTERDFVDPQAKGRLFALRADGWRIAIDDFGTGQSSLATIESLPIDRIKIDRAFVSSIDEKTVNRPVLDTIIHLAEELGVPLIAEGIETRSQWDYLAARGVASAQGYLMARPMPIADYLRWLEQPPAMPNQIALKLAPHQPLAELARAAPAAATGHGEALQTLSQAQRELWRRMGAAGGLQIQDRLHKLRTYPQCFVGAQALDWMVATLRVSRAEALRQGRALVAVGLVRHVLDEHDFKDGEFFYCLVPAVVSASAPAVATAAAADAAPCTEVEGLPAGRSTAVAPGKKVLLEALDFPWRSHRRGLLRHHRCASGREVVDWIVHRHPAPHATAQEWAAQWMRQGALRHVFDTQPFRDDHTLYRLG